MPELEGVLAHFTGADADRAVNAEYEDLAVADLSGLGCRHDGLRDLIRLMVGNSDLDPDLWHKVRRVFRTTINFVVPLWRP